MKILIITASSFGLNCIKHLYIKKKFNINVITYKEYKVKKKIIINYNFKEISNYCINKKIKITNISTNNQLENKINIYNKNKNTLIFLCGWYSLISKKILSQNTIYAFHASLLPKYAGGAPLVWALINNEKHTGLTLFKINKFIDSGPIIYQKKIKIFEKDDISSLYKKITKIAQKMLTNFFDDLKYKKIKYKYQNLKYQTIYPNRTEKDGLINFDKNQLFTHNFIRAQTFPYPGAYFYLKNKKITIWKSKLTNKKLIISKNNYLVLYNKNKFYLKLNNDSLIQILKISINNKLVKLNSLKRILQI